MIVVRYEGCTVEVMRECAAPETGYDYIGITRKNDRITIRTTDELYVNMPLTAVNLEAKLAKAGELEVAMALVGNYEAQRSRFDVSELTGRCERQIGICVTMTRPMINDHTRPQAQVRG